MDPDYYSPHLLAAQRALAAFEHAAAMVASGHAGHLPAATNAARSAVISTRTLAAWCDRQAWAEVEGPLKSAKE